MPQTITVQLQMVSKEFSIIKRGLLAEVEKEVEKLLAMLYEKDFEDNVIRANVKKGIDELLKVVKLEERMTTVSTKIQSALAGTQARGKQMCRADMHDTRGEGGGEGGQRSGDRIRTRSTHPMIVRRLRFSTL